MVLELLSSDTAHQNNVVFHQNGTMMTSVFAVNFTSAEGVSTPVSSLWL